MSLNEEERTPALGSATDKLRLAPMNQHVPAQTLTLKQFAAWLRAQPDDTKYPYPPSENCPIARYTGRTAACGSTGNPPWADFFIETYDCNREGRDGNQATALKALAKTEELFK